MKHPPHLAINPASTAASISSISRRNSMHTDQRPTSAPSVLHPRLRRIRTLVGLAICATGMPALVALVEKSAS